MLTQRAKRSCGTGHCHAPTDRKKVEELMSELMEEEFEKIRAIAKELRLWSEVYILTGRLPIISAFHILFYQKSGRAYYLIVPHPESGADPISAFAVGYLAAMTSKRVWEKGIELYLIAILTV